jgi:hypothetical protein
MREQLDATDFAKIKASSLLDFNVRYTEVKLASVSGADLSEHHLKATASLSYINQIVAARFEKYDLLDLFQEFPLIDPMEGWTSSTPTVDLFSTTDNVTFDQVKESVCWMRKNIDVEPSKTINEYDRDLDWSREILLKACDMNLCEVIMSEEKELSSIDRGYSGGPITFMIIMRKLSTLSADGLYDLYKYIQNLDIKNYEGEHVPTVTREIRAGLRRLEACSKERFVLPPTMMDDLIKVLQTTSCEEFNMTFKTLKIHQNIFGNKLNSHSLLEIADKTYKQLEDVWKAPSSSPQNQNGFNTTATGGIIQRRRRNGKDGNKGGKQGPEWFQPPDPKDQMCRKISENPTRWTKKIGQQVTHWCGKCQNRKTKKHGRWTNGDYRHFTDEHKKKDASDNGTEQQSQANLAATSATPAATGTNTQTNQSTRSIVSLSEAVQQLAGSSN